MDDGKSSNWIEDINAGQSINLDISGYGKRSFTVEFINMPLTLTVPIVRLTGSRVNIINICVTITVFICTRRQSTHEYTVNSQLISIDYISYVCSVIGIVLINQ